jgi:hypothetical protein
MGFVIVSQTEEEKKLAQEKSEAMRKRMDEKSAKFNLDFQAAIDAVPPFKKMYEENPKIKGLMFLLWDKGMKRKGKELK